ncbi:recombinase family protein [Arthrobacter sp. LAPM80]|uniref:recombinase family protein n=1 Tax=Arthrobacter sp. LAPM80 TaxID=3141788 RepID=UPI00398B8C1D
MRRNDPYIDNGLSGRIASRPALGEALNALHPCDALVFTTLDHLGPSTQNVLTLADELNAKGGNLRVPNSGGGDVDTSTPMGAMMFTVMTALAQMELDIKRERINDRVTKRRAIDGDLGGRREVFADSKIRSARQLVDAGMSTPQVVEDLGMSQRNAKPAIQ